MPDIPGLEFPELLLLMLAVLVRIGVLLNNAIAMPDIGGGLRLCLDALDTFSHELERAFRDRAAWPAIDLAQEPLLQAAARGVVSACRPWILETNIRGVTA
ncbi:MAG: hypothetical protein OXG44_20235 [Gammaproteobacteria bacterium]|nr:hypothetical protein [Gammaproteobacteria bacterium]